MEHPFSSQSEKIVSPFSDRQTEVTTPSLKARRRWLWISIGGLFLLTLGAISAIITLHYLNDPYRTLEEFPVGKYFDEYQSLAGSKYRADVRVEADLGWKDKAGRLMLFSGENDPRPFAIMIPVGVASGISFSKGQAYTAEVQVKEGGLIWAEAFRKD